MVNQKTIISFVCAWLFATIIVSCKDTGVPKTSNWDQIPGHVRYIEDILGNMIFIPETGSEGFMQGSPSTESCRDYNSFEDNAEKQFRHVLTRDIAVMETEVTRNMWAKLGELQSTLPTDTSYFDCSPSMNHPIQRVSWNEAILFANLLSIERGLTPCYYTNSDEVEPIDINNYTSESYFCNFDADGYRLPTEGEWEYFTRAGTTTPFSVIEENYNSGTCDSCNPGFLPQLEKSAQFCVNYSGVLDIVGNKLANNWNLHDVHGSVWEWCWDWIDSYPPGYETNYAGPTQMNPEKLKVVRGGACSTKALHCRSAQRGRSAFYDKFETPELIGFRLVTTITD